MDNIYMNDKPFKPKPKGLNKSLGGKNGNEKYQALDNSEKRVYVGVIIFLGLLSTSLLAGLIFFVISQPTGDLVSSLTEENNRLNVTVPEMNEELMRLRQTCPAGWEMFSGSCYLVSGCGSWDKGKDDCIKKDAQLVVINSADEQKFVAKYAEDSVWIGLNDKETEGTWKWVDGTSPNLTFWMKNQPDNGDNDSVEEDCAHIRNDDIWNDLPCSSSQQWICEKALKTI